MSAYTVERLPDEPIIIIRFKGKVNLQVVGETFDIVNQFAQEVGGVVYRISDYTETTSTFGEILQGMAAAAKQRAEGSVFDSKVRLMFVGTNQWIRLMRDMMQQPQFGNLQIPTFVSIEDALSFIRREIASGKEKTQETAQVPPDSPEDTSAKTT